MQLNPSFLNPSPPPAHRTRVAFCNLIFFCPCSCAENACAQYAKMYKYVAQFILINWGYTGVIWPLLQVLWPHVSQRFLVKRVMYSVPGFLATGLQNHLAAEVILGQHWSSVASLFLQQKCHGCWGSHTLLLFSGLSRWLSLVYSPTCNSAFTCHCCI